MTLKPGGYILLVRSKGGESHMRAYTNMYAYVFSKWCALTSILEVGLGRFGLQTSYAWSWDGPKHNPSATFAWGGKQEKYIRIDANSRWFQRGHKSCNEPRFVVRAKCSQLDLQSIQWVILNSPIAMCPWTRDCLESFKWRLVLETKRKHLVESSVECSRAENRAGKGTGGRG